MMINYLIHNSPILLKETMFSVSEYSDIGKNLIYLLNENGYTDLISYKYPLNIPELGITIKEITYKLYPDKCI